jgi:hypothetical protein
MTALPLFVAGLLTMGYAVTSLFFAKFWTQSHDRLFGFFSAAFALLAVQRVMVAFAPQQPAVYVLRLIAFIVIIVAIVDKNRA